MDSACDEMAKEGKRRDDHFRGWIYRKRHSGGMVFLVLRNSDRITQAVVKKDNVNEESWNAAIDSTIESSVEVWGSEKSDSRSPYGMELTVSRIRLTGKSEPFPISEYQSTELLLDKRHLWLRSQRMIQIMKIRAGILKYSRSFLDKKGFYEISPPLITEAGGETGADLFEMNYFGKKAYMTESSQLYAEAMVFPLGKVYSLAPSYRAEKSRTTKHLAEYWHLEPEMAYYDNRKNMRLQEELVSSVASMLMKKHSQALESLGVDKKQLSKIRPPFKRISYSEAIELLNTKGMRKKWGEDLGSEDEKVLTAEEEKPVFVYNWPKDIKPFYMPINPEDTRTVMCSDLQAPHGHGEIIGGSERIWRLDELMERIKDVEKVKGIRFDMEKYGWWIDLRRYGSVPHAGFGLGIERLTKWLLNLDHIRDAIPFPRMINRLNP